jgi:hypothetical protein
MLYQLSYTPRCCSGPRALRNDSNLLRVTIAALVSDAGGAGENPT